MLARYLAVAALALAVSQPASAQMPSGAAADYWVGLGRFTRDSDAPKTGKEQLPDLSGNWDVEGRSPGDSGSEYSTTMTVKRWKTLKSPQGAKFTTYRFDYNWDDKVPGIGILIGKRLYYAFGTEGMDLYVGAPLSLTENEAQTYAKYFEVYYKTEYKDNSKYVKNRPWFYNLSGDFKESGYDPAYYFIRVSTNDTYAYEIIQHIPAWQEGKFSGLGGLYQEDGDFQVYRSGMVGRPRTYTNRWELTDQGMNHHVKQTVSSKDVVQGAGMLLEDGVVLIMTGLDDDSGFGYYEVKGNLMTGPYANLMGASRGTETLKASAEMMAKNPSLFGR